MTKLSELLTEAVYGSPTILPVDGDENQYRRLTQARRDLPIVEQARMIEWSAYLYTHNPLARRLIELQKDWCLGEGLGVTADDESVRKLVQSHWNNFINDWTVKGAKRFNDLRLFGEACYPVAVKPGSGLVVLGVVDPSRIKAAVRDENQIDEIDHIILNAAYVGGPEQRFKVIRENPMTGKLEDGNDEPDRNWDGSCFYFSINQVATASRGVSDLFALIDYIDAADQFLWSVLERAKLQNAQIFDVSVEGTDQDVTREEQRIRQKNPTRPGTVNVHTKTIEWQILKPELGAQDAADLEKSLLRWVAGGVGFPEAWFGTAEGVSKGALEGQSDPSVKRLTSIQKHWISCINLVLRYQYEQAQAHGGWNNKTLPDLKPDEGLPWRIEAPDMQVKDLSRLGAMINQLVTALAEAEAMEYVSKDTGRRTFLSLLKLFGTETAPDKEEEKIANQPPPDYQGPLAAQNALGGGQPGQSQPGAPKPPNPNPQAAGVPGANGLTPSPAQDAAAGQNKYMNSRATEALELLIDVLTGSAPLTFPSKDMELDEQTVIHKNSGKKKVKSKAMGDDVDSFPQYDVEDDGESRDRQEGERRPQDEGEIMGYATPEDDANPLKDRETGDELKTKKKKKGPAKVVAEGLIVYRGLADEASLLQGKMYGVAPSVATRVKDLVDSDHVLEVRVADGTTVLTEGDDVLLPRGVLEVGADGTATFRS